MGAILAAISYVAMIVFGIKTQHNFSIKKINLESIKTAGAELVKNTREGVSKATHNFSESVSSTTTSSASSKKHVDETLVLIERLAKMKDDGILSEEEFKEKKTKLLEDIKMKRPLAIITAFILLSQIRRGIV